MKVSAKFGFAFSNFPIGSKTDDPQVFFCTRMNQKNGLNGWIDSRTGRVSERSNQKNLVIDHRNPDTQKRIMSYFKKF